MIITKRQLIHQTLEGYNLNDNIIKKVIRKALRIPEICFMQIVKEELNYNIEPIRKNTYLLS